MSSDRLTGELQRVASYLHTVGIGDGACAVDDVIKEVERLREQNASLLLDEPSKTQGLYAAVEELQRVRNEKDAELEHVKADRHQVELNYHHMVNEAQRLRVAHQQYNEALDRLAETSAWYVRCLRDVNDRKPVRGLGEASEGFKHAYREARALLQHDAGALDEEESK